MYDLTNCFLSGIPGGGKIELENWPKFDSSKLELDYKVKAPVKSAETRKSSASTPATPYYVDTKSGLGPLPGLPKLGQTALDVMEVLEAELDDDDEDDDDELDDDDGDGVAHQDTNGKNDDFDTDATNTKYNGRNGIKNDRATRMDDNDLTFYPKEVDTVRKPAKKSKQQQKPKKTSSSGGRKVHVDNEPRRDSSSSVCSPQEYEILKVRAKSFENILASQGNEI